MNEHLTGAHRLYFIGTVKVTSPLHIGSGETVLRPDRPDTDSPVQLDASGAPYLPATALGGLLRGTAINLVTVLENWKIDPVLSLFGAAREEDRRPNPSNKNHPSRLRLYHATLKEKEKWHEYTTVRDGVGIDRQRSSARKGALYNYEVVPANTTFDLCIELRDSSPEDRQLLALTLETLHQLPTSIGAKGNSGLGALQLCIKKVVEVNLMNNPDTLLKFLSQEHPFNPRCEEGKSWSDWRNEILATDVTLKLGLGARWRIPQAITFTYRFTVEDPLLIRGQESPEGALDDYQKRKPKLSTDTKGIDATWIGSGVERTNRDRWEPTVPGPSLRGIFRSHCERILRTLSWHYANSDEAEYKRKVAASDPLDQSGKKDPKQGSHLRSSGFALQETVKKSWNARTAGEADERKLHEAGEAIAAFIWRDSDLGERMWGSSQWKSHVSVSEACLPTEEDKKAWRELLFQHVAINRFTGGAAEQKLFNALAVTHATFEGTVTVFGNEIWMLGPIALLFKDLHDGLIRVGSGKTRGYGKVEGWLKQVEVKALKGSKLAETCAEISPLPPEDSNKQVFQTWSWGASSKAFLDKADLWLKTLLEQGVTDLKKQVRDYTRFEYRKNEEDKADVRDDSSQSQSDT